MARYQQKIVFCVYGFCAVIFLNQQLTTSAFLLQLQTVQEQDNANDEAKQDIAPTLDETVQAQEKDTDSTGAEEDGRADKTGDIFKTGFPPPDSGELEQGGSDDLSSGTADNRTKRAVDCGQSPPGVHEPCISCNGESTFFHTDVNGHTCQCDVCRPPKYMLAPCICTADNHVESGPICSLPKLGEEYMDVSNWCPRPFKCLTECKGDLEVTTICTPTEDTKCGCPKDTHPTSPTTCEAIPPCPKDQEIHEIPSADSAYSTYECVPCEPGYTQPYDNSLERCRPIEDNSVVTESPQIPDKDEQADEGQNKDDSVTLSPSPSSPSPTAASNDGSSGPPLPSSSDQSTTTCDCKSECPCPKLKCPDPDRVPSDQKEPTTDDASEIDLGKERSTNWCIPVILMIVGVCFVSNGISLVCGSKYPEKVKLLAKRLNVHGWIYESSSVESGEPLQPSGSLGSLENIITSETDRLTTQNVTSDELKTSGNLSVQSKTSRTTKGGRIQAQQKYVRERSKNPTRDCTLNGNQT